LTTGAALSVDPVTATLPVVPFNVHSGVPAFAGAVVGHAASVADWVMGEEVTSAAEGVVAGDAVLSEPQAARAKAIDAAPATRATEEETREKFMLIHGTAELTRILR
jgi:hypothetical protein